MDRLRTALKETLCETRSFDVTVSRVGTFPGGRKAPRVVWLGLEDGVDCLREVAGRVEDTCVGLGFVREGRPFRAHVTIGRVRRGSGGLDKLAESVAGTEFKRLKLRVDRVNLVRSRLSPQGPTYTVLESVALKEEKGGWVNGSEKQG
jgi:2'-5' RNA ligase